MTTGLTGCPVTRSSPGVPGLSPTSSSSPELYALAQSRRKFLFDDGLKRFVVIARAEVREDDQLVFESVGPFQDVVQMRMAELVDFFFAMFRTEKRHFGDQH